MGENTANTKEKPPKKGIFAGMKSWFRGLKSEFKKIIWPDKDTLVKESAAAIVITVILGIVIALIDMVIETGLHLII